MNNKIAIILLCFIIIPFISKSQNYDDAVNFSSFNHNGTARFASMGGAFGALGGDFTSLSYNPAGSGVYRGSEFVLSTAFLKSNTSSSLFDNSAEDFKYNLGINTLGLVFSNGTGVSSGWVTWSLAFGYNKLMNYHNKIIMEGDNPYNSLADVMANNANNGTYDFYYEDLFYDAYVIDDGTGVYRSSIQGGSEQRKTITRNGSAGEYFLNIGANYNHKLYLGMTIGLQQLYFHEESNHTETAKIPPAADSLANSFTFREELTTKGAGFNFKVGAIYKPIQPLRIGLALHLPTFSRLKDKYITSITSSEIDGYYYPANDNGNLGNLRNKYSMDSYTSHTSLPFKGIGSLAYVLKNIGLVSFDYEYVDYTTLRLRDGEDGYDFYKENQNIADTLTQAMNIRAGAEINLNSFFLRGGYAFYGSPYKNFDASYSLISGGFGFKGDNIYLDIGYIYRDQTTRHVLYNISGSKDPIAEINNNNGEFIVTFGVRY